MKEQYKNTNFFLETQVAGYVVFFGMLWYGAKPHNKKKSTRGRFM